MQAKSKPMTQILERLLAYGEFTVVYFGDACIHDAPVEAWPLCDCLVSFYSENFPLAKAEAYAQLRKPFVLNDLSKQHWLLDRRKVYEVLQAEGILVPPHAVVSRDAAGVPDVPFEETEQGVVVNGVAINKPLVEKPVSGEDHNVNILYPLSMGGGGKMLFRKRDDRSAEFVPELNHVRRDGSYIYEAFLPTMGTDVKVYSVGMFYAHAEARKSPTVDGRVHRQVDGKEVRYPVLLNTAEKEIARRVTLAFGQTVCGFDLLRSGGKSYVCDVNGWSFVKNSTKYFEDTAGVLRTTILAAVAPHVLAAALPSPARRLPPAEASAPRRDGSGSGMTNSGSAASFGGSDSGEGGEELRCVIAVFRHGDRTPKQKMKLTLRDTAFLALYAAHRPRGARAEQVKLKSAEALQGVLDACCDMLRRLEDGQDCGVNPEDCGEKIEKLRAVITVLNRKSDSGGHFSGINRKVQLKPLSFAADAAEGEEQRVTELQLIVKHGGVLTHSGRAQAEALGSEFRRTVYPPASRYDPDDACGEGAGLLRLHSTYRHDLKIWSSDEGRVQMSAAAFAKGLLDLEGTSLAPILVSLVNLNGFMLDAFDKGASEDIRAAKAVVSRFMTAEATPPPPPGPDDPPLTPPRHSEAEERSPRAAAVSPGPEDELAALSLAELGAGLTAPPVELLREMLVHIAALREEIQEKIWAARHGGAGLGSSGSSPSSSSAARDPSPGPPGGAPAACSEESLFLLLERWRKLERGLYNTRRGVFDISKVPDVYDAVKYDALHSRHWGLANLGRLHAVAKQLADVVIPNEYGVTPPQKLAIGGKICSTLLGKILRDFGAVREEATVAWREATLQRSSSTMSSMGRMSHVHLADDGGASGGEEEDDGGFRLHAQYAEDVNSTSRHVRTRVYFTSESHLHALVNVIRYAHLAAGEQSACAPLVSAAGEAALARVSELDYMSTVVFRMFELKGVDPKDPNKFRMELLFSPGAAGDPFAAPEGSHALPVTPRVPLWADPAGGPALTLNRVEATLGAHAAGWRSKGCPELGQLGHQRSASGSSALGARDSG